MTSSSVQSNYEEMEDHTYRFLGRFFVIFARIELNLTLRVGDKGNFSDKLERFLVQTATQHGDNNLKFCEIFAWYMAADSVRDTRNRFAHGRWGFHTHAQRVVHVSGYPPASQFERFYSLAQLDSIIMDIELLDEELGKIP